MKISFILLFLAASVSCSLYTSVVLEEWEEYKLLYGKKYDSELEDSFRMNIFIKNKLRIASHNKLYYAGLKSFNLKMNKFGDLLSSEVNAINFGLRTCNLTHIRSYRKTNAIPYDVPEVYNLPETVNWVEKGAVTEVKDQAYCGSCWAFSTTGSLEGQHFLKTGQLVSLSEQNLLDCSSSFGNHGCDGGCVDYAYEYVKSNHGIDTEDSYPYKAKENGVCSYDPKTSGSDELGYVDLPEGDEDALKKAVATSGPISVSIDASHYTFQYYNKGVYDEPKCLNAVENLDHAVLAVGYGTENGKDYWLVKNSWGEIFGEDGYIKMSRNKANQCGIATLACFPLV